MLQKITIPFALVTISVLLQYCSRTPCGRADLHFQLISFSDAESDSIFLRRYTKGQNFQQLKDTTLLQISFRRSNDTLFQSSSSTPGLITSDYDHEFYFPIANKTYRITEINEVQSEIKHSIFHPTKEGCGNSISSLKINGQLVSSLSFNYFYLTK
jgi:hypothetical protein